MTPSIEKIQRPRSRKLIVFLIILTALVIVALGIFLSYWFLSREAVSGGALS
jgi:flagellar basal body-associated protein FliL